MQRPPIDQLEKDIGHRFKNKELAFDALTHSSAGDHNYERLEFLGDRVLGLSVAEILYEKFPDESEGDLAKRLAALVQGNLLAEIAATLNLGNYLNFSDAERDAGGQKNENILGDALEALLGALYLDAGFAACRKLIEKLWQGRFDDMAAPPSHPKTALQEWAQGQGLPLPTYKIVAQSGPDHSPLFTVELRVKGYDPLQANGRSRQTAEKAAALLFLERISK